MSNEDLPRHVGLVLQEPFLFRATIAENIAYGRPAATPAAIIDAAKAANAHTFIMRQPSGYDTRLGERGAGLSGVEKQRISIARALLCDPSILILDEATSDVDTESELQIREALSVLCQGRTTISPSLTVCPPSVVLTSSTCSMRDAWWNRAHTMSSCTTRSCTIGW